MGLLTERYFGYDIPGWARAEDLDDYFITIDASRATHEVLAMTNDPELVRFWPTNLHNSNPDRGARGLLLGCPGARRARLLPNFGAGGMPYTRYDAPPPLSQLPAHYLGLSGPKLTPRATCAVRGRA